MPKLGLGIAKPILRQTSGVSNFGGGGGGSSFTLEDAPLHTSPSDTTNQSAPLYLKEYNGGDGYQISGGDHNSSGWCESGLGLVTGVNQTTKQYNTSTPLAYNKAGEAFSFEAYNHANYPRKMWIMAKDDYEKFGVGVNPYNLMRFQGAKGLYFDVINSTGKPTIYRSLGNPALAYTPEYDDGWGTTFTYEYRANPYQPNQNVPLKFVITEEGILQFYKNGVLEYESEIPIDYDYVFLCEGHYLTQYSRNVKVSGTFYPYPYTMAWDDGEWMQFQMFGTSNVNLYNDDYVVFGNGNNAQVRTTYRMMPDSWIEWTSPIPENQVHSGVGAQGCNHILTNVDHSEGIESGVISISDGVGIKVHHQHGSQSNSYLNGVNFNRKNYGNVYESNATIEQSGWTTPTKANAMHIKTQGHRLRWYWTQEKELEVWLNHSLYGLIFIYKHYSPDLVEYLNESEYLHPWMLWNNPYSYAQIQVKMGGNIEEY